MERIVEDRRGEDKRGRGIGKYGCKGELGRWSDGARGVSSVGRWNARKRAAWGRGMRKTEELGRWSEINREEYIYIKCI